MPFWGDAYQTLPCVIAMVETTGTVNAQNAFNGAEFPYAVGLKSGTHNIVAQQQVSVNGITAVQQIANVNVLNSYLLLTSTSADGLQRLYGESTFWPDSSTSFSFGAQNAVSPAGHGFLNNISCPSFPADVYSTSSIYQGAWNEGLYRRQLLTGLDITDAPISTFTTEQIASQAGISYYKPYAGKNAKVWFHLANHKLADLHDLFRQFPLARGVSFQINQQIALGTASFAVTIAGGVLTDLSCTNIQTRQPTFPLMLANGSKDFQGLKPLIDAYAGAGDGVYTFSLSLSIGSDVNLGIAHPTITNTTISVPCYTLTPSALELYMSRNRIKTIKYLDNFFFSQPYSVSGDQVSINAVISNQITAPKRLWVIAFGQTNLANGANAQYQPVSPFDSAPSGSALPWLQYYQVNCQVGGKNVFQSDEKYGFTQWQDEASQLNALNGGFDNRLTSGLVSYQDFYSKLGAVYIDIGRRLPNENLIPKAITFTGTLYTHAVSNLVVYYFVQFENTMKVDTSSGVIVFNDRA
jgi:hypothetical protein